MTETKREFISTPIGGEFGISVAFNNLQDVIDYEEGTIVPDHGYPRFVPHKCVTQRENLARMSSGMPHAVAFPTQKQARFVINDFILRHPSRFDPFPLDDAGAELFRAMHPRRRSTPNQTGKERLPLVEVDGLHIVCLKREADADRLRKMRRVYGTGFDVHRLSRRTVEIEGEELGSLEGRIIHWEGDRAKAALMFQSGMAAIAALILLAVRLKRRLVLLGPAYVDTGIIASDWARELPGLECAWLPSDATREDIDRELGRGPALVLLEIPSNPGLVMPDIPLLLDVASKHDVLLAVDATVATPYNFQGLSAGFDLVMHSSSKFLGGHFDHLGGVITGASPNVLDKLQRIRDIVDIGMCENQRAILRNNLAGFEKRMETINRNAREVALTLADSKQIDKVWYPGFGPESQARLADTLLRPGRSGLLSFSLKEKGLEPLRKFYDAVRAPMLKGPGLGGEASMLCPYVMLAHYHDTEAFLASQGLDRHSLRLSVGTEPVHVILSALGIAR